MNVYYKYHKNTVYITLNGFASKESIRNFNKKILYITNSKNIVINTKMVENKDILFGTFITVDNI